MESGLVYKQRHVPITLRRIEIKGKQVDLEHVGTCPDRNLIWEGVMKLVDLKKKEDPNLGE